MVCAPSTQCCCGVPLRPGVLFIVFLNLVINVFFLTRTVTQVFLPDSFETVGDLQLDVFTANFCFVGLPFIAMGMWAVHTRDELLLRAYLYYFVVVSIIALAFIISSTRVLTCKNLPVEVQKNTGNAFLCGVIGIGTKADFFVWSQKLKAMGDSHLNSAGPTSWGCCGMLFSMFGCGSCCAPSSPCGECGTYCCGEGTCCGPICGPDAFCASCVKNSVVMCIEEDPGNGPCKWCCSAGGATACCPDFCESCCQGMSGSDRFYRESVYSEAASPMLWKRADNTIYGSPTYPHDISYPPKQAFIAKDLSYGVPPV
eukprot:TRINITY_DN4356_c0_g1_i1.p1 TRINITY_DN4356_c0_g1~~TRINITY_DN4356_c0_g1_i1.p1  ORF type:complete len:313 (-),score=31.28 TRINITY_DN4356_c0_g1_i1:328-1266(-)